MHIDTNRRSLTPPDLAQDRMGAPPSLIAFSKIETAIEGNEFSVVLTDAGRQTAILIDLIRLILRDAGLLDISHLIGSAPVNLNLKISKTEAEDIKLIIEKAGGKAEII